MKNISVKVFFINKNNVIIKENIENLEKISLQIIEEYAKYINGKVIE